MKKVFICSPFRGNELENMLKASEYCRTAIAQGCMPYAPHIYFTAFLDDKDSEQRDVGIKAGLEWLRMCREIWVYGTPTEGMRLEIAEAEKIGTKVVYRDA